MKSAAFSGSCQWSVLRATASRFRLGAVLGSGLLARWRRSTAACSTMQPANDFAETSRDQLKMSAVMPAYQPMFSCWASLRIAAGSSSLEMNVSVAAILPSLAP